MGFKKALCRLSVLSMLLGTQLEGWEQIKGVGRVAAMDITDETMHEQVYHDDDKAA